MRSISSLVFAIFLFIKLAQGEVFDITAHGGKPDTEISKALCDTWTAACASTTPSTLLIPAGNYCLDSFDFKGPCKAPIEVKIDGNVKAKEDPAVIPKGKQWITFTSLTCLTVSGSGTLDGVGAAMAWPSNDPKKRKEKPCYLQYNLSFNFINNSLITGITTKDSKMFHVNLMTCFNVTFDNFHVCAPGDSPNTDGIHIAWSKEITIKNSVFRTGDDCISIGDGCENLRIEGVQCGPGHGISIGSLGKTPGEKPVVGVYVKNCSFTETSNGVRIKTWPDSHPGEVTEMHFEDLIMDKVQNPVIIDQEYCPHNSCHKEKPSLVNVHNVYIKNVKGSGTDPAVVKLRCSTANGGCDNVHVSDIKLTYDGPLGPARQECCNVCPVYEGEMCPPGCQKNAKNAEL